MTKTKKLLEKAELIRLAAAKQMEADYPIGMEVTWRHGDNLRSGVIESYGYRASIFVRTATGKRVDMDIEKVRE